MSRGNKRLHGAGTRGNQAGFTLIEVAIAMAIFGIGIIAIVGLQTRDAVRNNDSKRTTASYVWAMDQVERLLSADYTAADMTVQGDPTVTGDGHLVTQGPYTVEWDVVDNTAAIRNTRLVHVFVRWGNDELARVDFTRAQDVF
ncbi:MAG: hypothetical protein CSA34_03180 [Desulfobulbus propionicus]|nr:MAG: hypothetical protein CSA34_03180 [Desulfobulbus propionicus]